MSDATTTDVVVREHSTATDVAAAIQGLNTGAAFFSTVKGDDFDTKLAVAEALTTSLPVDENLGKLINLANIIVQPVELTDEKTGEVNTAPRVVLLDADGTAYHGTSVGLLSSVRNILAALGDPSTWAKPVSINVVKQKGNNGYSFFTIKFVKSAAK